VANAGELVNESPSSIVVSLLEIPTRTREEETELERRLYEVATADKTTREIAVMLSAFGSTYTNASWGKVNKGDMRLNTQARNALRRWANKTLKLNLPMVPPALRELESAGLDTCYLGDKPMMVLVIGQGADEVVVHNLSRPAIEEMGQIPGVHIAVVTGRKAARSEREGTRLGLSLTRPFPADSVAAIRESHDMTWNQTIAHLIATHALYDYEHSDLVGGAAVDDSLQPHQLRRIHL
jgi:hypothetical protein